LIVIGILMTFLGAIILIPPVAGWFGANGLSVLLLVIALLSPLYLLGSYFISQSYRPKLMRTLRRMFGKNSQPTGKNLPDDE
jgi:hypothetical protein